MSNEISVSVPAHPEHVRLLRLVASSVAAGADFHVDEIDDLCLAVDEAAAHVLSAAGASSTLTLRVLPVPGGLRVTVGSDASPRAWPPPDADRGLAWVVLSALTSEVGYERDGGPAVSFTTRRTAGGPR